MKKLASILTLTFLLSGFIFVENASAKPKKAGKHKSHKKTKVSKSGYYYNFQH
ncbi:MAG: hypothetical protein H7259_07440 [Cytophagales bacterium]|nr:hypothetical protein [Cytophaga sp.]